MKFENNYFVGIGGIGMSGAELLKNLNFKISGSDISDNTNVSRLKNLGIEFQTVMILKMLKEMMH